MSKFAINNGDKVESRTTGFKGLVTARAEHIHGCNRYFVQPPTNEKGDLTDGYWFDEPDLEVTVKKAVNTPVSKTGGPICSIK